MTRPEDRALSRRATGEGLDLVGTNRAKAHDCVAAADRDLGLYLVEDQPVNLFPEPMQKGCTPRGAALLDVALGA